MHLVDLLGIGSGLGTDGGLDMITLLKETGQHMSRDEPEAPEKRTVLPY